MFKTSLLLGVILMVCSLNANASCCSGCCSGYVSRTYEVVDSCNYGCGAGPVNYYTEYEYYSSPHRYRSHTGSGEMAEYIWIDP